MLANGVERFYFSVLKDNLLGAVSNDPSVLQVIYVKVCEALRQFIALYTIIQLHYVLATVCALYRFCESRRPAMRITKLEIHFLVFLSSLFL
jgi:hypothetical protein